MSHGRDEFKLLLDQLNEEQLLREMPEWRKAWMRLPPKFRGTLYRNAGLSVAESDGPLKDRTRDELSALITAAGRYADLCKKAEAFLLNERDIRDREAT